MSPRKRAGLRSIRPETEIPAKIIDLSKFRDPDVTIFAGRERALHIRKACGVVDGDNVDLRIPINVYCLAAGFADTLLWNVKLIALEAPAGLFDVLIDAGRDTHLLFEVSPDE